MFTGSTTSASVQIPVLLKNVKITISCSLSPVAFQGPLRIVALTPLTWLGIRSIKHKMAVDLYRALSPLSLVVVPA
jgi:hypothetical protein